MAINVKQIKKDLKVVGTILIVLLCIAAFISVIAGLALWTGRNDPGEGAILRTETVTQTLQGKEVTCLVVTYAQDDAGDDKGVKMYCTEESR